MKLGNSLNEDLVMVSLEEAAAFVCRGLHVGFLIKLFSSPYRSPHTPALSVSAVWAESQPPSIMPRGSAGVKLHLQDDDCLRVSLKTTLPHMVDLILLLLESRAIIPEPSELRPPYEN